MYEQPDGEFLPYVNATDIDLSILQTYTEIPKEHRDSCFVDACIQSNMFTKDEIDYLRSIVRTRKLP